MSDQKNLLIAIVCSVAILLGWQVFYDVPRMERLRAEQGAQQAQQQPAAPAGQASSAPPVAGAPAPAAAPAVPGSVQPAQPVLQNIPSRQGALDATARVAVDGPRIRGSVNLVGGRIDDVVLKGYREGVDPKSPEIALFSPAGAPHPYYAEFGWTVAPGADTRVPGPDTLWTAKGDIVSDRETATLSWDNGQGLVFTRRIALDANFLFTVTSRVENRSDKPVTLYPYALVSRTGTPPTAGFYILHEGPLGVFDKTLVEHSYDDLKDKKRQEKKSTGGWIGMTDKYWLSALIPEPSSTVSAGFSHTAPNKADKYQVDYLGAAQTVQPGASAETLDRLFAGAKEVGLLDRYGSELGIAIFDRAVDFGWFYFLTKPIFIAVEFFFRQTGNFGIAILLLTVLVRGIMFPLANKSYKSMSQMKKLQPEMEKLRERCGEDRQRMQREMMELYKREKVNPMAGCLPILVQIPVFFALYKVLFVTIEMRHAPFYGWIADLSAPDPTSLWNLFGLLPWEPSGMFAPGAALGIGIWPIVMGVTMFLQQKMNPAPADPVQAKIFMFLPILFTFMLAPFPAGLVIYWSWNNVLSMAQQWIIMKRMGVGLGGPVAHAPAAPSASSPKGKK
jgi:YidC/Oxa1 family membrane protein insertase